MLRLFTAILIILGRRDLRAIKLFRFPYLEIITSLNNFSCPVSLCETERPDAYDPDMVVINLKKLFLAQFV